jgi:hypothetical protein
MDVLAHITELDEWLHTLEGTLLGFMVGLTVAGGWIRARR